MNLPEGATPLDPEEAQALIPSLSTQGELNEFEAANIVEAATWARRSKKVRQALLSDSTLRELHRRMFGETWRWAGIYRVTQKSIGCEAWQIGSSMRNLLEDIKVWLEFGTYPSEEIAARFHHRLVWIHPFANGNGRFARLATDLLCEQQGWPKSKWGSKDLASPGEARQDYIAALRAADVGDISRLIEFMTR